MKKQIRMMVAMLVGMCAWTLCAAVTYTYSGAGQAGVWTDPANWTASDSTTTGYPGSAATDVAQFPKDAAAVMFDFGGATISFATLYIGEKDTDGTAVGTADITLKNGTMTISGEAIFGSGTSVRLSEGMVLSAGSTANPNFCGTFVVDNGCSYTTSGMVYTGFGVDKWGSSVDGMVPVIRIAGTFTVAYININTAAQIILEGGTYVEKSGNLAKLRTQERDLSNYTGTGVFKKDGVEWTFTAGLTNAPALSPDVTYVWTGVTGGTDAIMNLTCGTIELTQSAVESIFNAGAKRSGFNFPEGSKAKVVFSNYTPESIEAFFASQIFSTIGNYVGPHIYVNGKVIESVKQLKSRLNIELPYKDGKGVAISLRGGGLIIRIQ